MKRRAAFALGTALLATATTWSLRGRSAQRAHVAVNLPHIVQEALPGLASRARIPADSAWARAVTATGPASVEAERIEQRSDRLVYVFQLRRANDGAALEVVVDAVSGDLLTSSPRHLPQNH